jgi:hypothetical protein
MIDRSSKADAAIVAVNARVHGTCAMVLCQPDWLIEQRHQIEKIVFKNFVSNLF